MTRVSASPFGTNSRESHSSSRVTYSRCAVVDAAAVAATAAVAAFAATLNRSTHTHTRCRHQCRRRRQSRVPLQHSRLQRRFRHCCSQSHRSYRMRSTPRSRSMHYHPNSRYHRHLTRPPPSPRHLRATLTRSHSPSSAQGNQSCRSPDRDSERTEPDTNQHPNMHTALLSQSATFCHIFILQSERMLPFLGLTR